MFVYIADSLTDTIQKFTEVLLVFELYVHRQVKTVLQIVKKIKYIKTFVFRISRFWPCSCLFRVIPNLP